MLSNRTSNIQITCGRYERLFVLSAYRLTARNSSIVICWLECDECDDELCEWFDWTANKLGPSRDTDKRAHDSNSVLCSGIIPNEIALHPILESVPVNRAGVDWDSSAINALISVSCQLAFLHYTYIASIDHIHIVATSFLPLKTILLEEEGKTINLWTKFLSSFHIVFTCIVLLRRLSSWWWRISKTTNPFVLNPQYTPRDSGIIFIVFTTKQVVDSKLINHLLHYLCRYLKNINHQVITDFWIVWLALTQFRF